VGLIVMKRKEPEPGPPIVTAPPVGKMSEEARLKFLRDGWKESSSKVLGDFLRAGTVEQKARFVIGGEARIEDMRAFYGEAIDLSEAETPIDLFSHFDLDIADKKRGLFLMQYERPAHFDMTEFFRPVAPLEVQHKIEPPGLLLSAFATPENFAMDPMRVMAFFKEQDGKLLLDWDVYAQTKYRALRHFTNHPQAGRCQAFRVMVREELPASTGLDVTQHRFFRFSDPAHVQDFAQVPVPVESMPGRVLADIAWINIPGRQAQDRYATVELAWTQEEDPRLFLKKVICWEFLGLGGVEGNADPVGAPESSPPELDQLGPDPLAPPAPDASQTVTAPGEPSGEELPPAPSDGPGTSGHDPLAPSLPEPEEETPPSP
jgi:hypothetical protein